MFYENARHYYWPMSVWNRSRGAKIHAGAELRKGSTVLGPEMMRISNFSSLLLQWKNPNSILFVSCVNQICLQKWSGIRMCTQRSFNFNCWLPDCLYSIVLTAYPTHLSPPWPADTHRVILEILLFFYYFLLAITQTSKGFPIANRKPLKCRHLPTRFLQNRNPYFTYNMYTACIIHITHINNQ